LPRNPFSRKPRNGVMGISQRFSSIQLRHEA
jgi:hypothetical protein